MLGKTFLKMDNKFSAEYYLKLVTQYPAKTVEDHQVNLFVINPLKPLGNLNLFISIILHKKGGYNITMDD